MKSLIRLSLRSRGCFGEKLSAIVSLVAVVFSTALTASADLARPAAAASRTLYVSPSAGPVRDGSSAHPFASPFEAQTALRERRRASSSVGAWTVEFAPGDYQLDKTLTFLPEDSGSPDAPIVWRASAKGDVCFLGARDVTEWRVRPDGRWETALPLREDGSAPVWCEQLFVNGRRAKRARFPNSGFLRPISAKETELSKGFCQMELFAAGDDLAPFAACSPDYLRFTHLVVHHKWSTTRRIIRGFDAARASLRTEGGPISKWNTWNAHSTYYIENAPFALDEPGEWFTDGVRKTIVYLPRPGETPQTTRIQIPVPGLLTLLRFAGDPAKGTVVHDVVFENIDLRFSDSPRRGAFTRRVNLPAGEVDTDNDFAPSEFPPSQAASYAGAAVLADGAHRIVLRGCGVSHVGEYGVWLREGCVSNTLTRCTILHPGAGGIRIGTTTAPQKVAPGERVTRLTTARGTGYNTVDNCILAHGGRRFAEGVGVWIGHSPFNTVTHCEITDFYYTGVSIGWVWGYAGSLAQGNTLSFCHIHDIGQGVLSDMGGVYTLGTSYGSAVTNNIFHAIDSRSYGGWGLYPDEGSEGILFENNLVYDTKDASFHQHYGKNNILRNNILAFSRQGQIALTRAEAHLSFTAERNIVVWQDGQAFKRYPATLQENGKIRWKDNFWWTLSGTPSFNGKTFAQWQAKGNDVNGLVVDPQFVDIAKRDFRLKPSSPVIAAGFRPFDLSRVGVLTQPAGKRVRP